MALLENFDFGGVDSRSNPLNMPQNRALRMCNFTPSRDGSLHLAYGYAAVTMSAVVASAIHTMLDYELWDGTKYLLLAQGSSLKKMAIADGTISSVATVSSAARWGFFRDNDRIYMGNGTDQKWYDGVALRPSGIRGLTEAEVASVIVTLGMFAPTASESAAVTITVSATGGDFGPTIYRGILLYMAYYDSGEAQELGPPAQIGGRIPLTNTATTQKFVLGSLPNLTARSATSLKLFGRTSDDSPVAHLCTTGAAKAITSVSRTSSVVTVACAGHGFSTNDIISVSGIADDTLNGLWVVTVTDADHFTYAQTTPHYADATSTTGSASKALTCAAATTALDIITSAVDSAMVFNEAAGLPPTVFPSDVSNRGFQFHAAIYDPVGGHIGNRVAIGSRFFPAEFRNNVRVDGLPDLTAENPDWRILIGRTVDAGEVPYAVCDSGYNWFSVPPGNTGMIPLRHALYDGDAELPIRNTPAPDSLSLFCVTSERAYAADTVSGYFYYTRSRYEAGLIGDWAQCWPANNTEPSPNHEPCVGLFEEDDMAWIFTRDHFGVYGELSGTTGWQRGPYRGGLAGSRAFLRTVYGNFWVDNHKRLMTIDQTGPVPVSDEYEAALLGRIGDAYLGNVELRHVIDVPKGIDRLVIYCQDASGVPFHVYHDFQLEDSRSPFGQGYERIYAGPLVNAHTLAEVRDANGACRIWAGGNDGRIYQLFTGHNDAGVEFSADAILLENAGANRPVVENFEWQGDGNLQVSILRKLNKATADFLSLVTKAKVGGRDDYHWVAEATGGTEIKNSYVRLQLTSHSADAPAAPLNDPPHLPLEYYGAVYVTRANVGEARGAE